MIGVLVTPCCRPMLVHSTTEKVAVFTNTCTHCECVDELKLQVELLEAERPSYKRSAMV